MRRVASSTRLHFGDRMIFDPYIDEASKRVLWVNTAADEDTVLQWEHDMGEATGLRAEVTAVMEMVSMDLLDPITDQRLDRLRQAATLMESAPV